MRSKQKGSISIGQLIGACVGAVFVATIVGFSFGGWVTGSTAEAMAKKLSEQAVTERLGKICVAQAQQSADIQAQLDALKKESSYKRAKSVMEMPWAVMPGEDAADRAVAGACANTLVNS
jgi:alpha/beta superfamily hydrolase